MDITLTNILYVYDAKSMYAGNCKISDIKKLDGYRITFLINKKIEGNIQIDSYDKELSIDEIKQKIYESLVG